MKNIIDHIYLLFSNGRSLETKLAAYQGYSPNSIISWKKQTNLKWKTILKILNRIEIYNSPRIRSLIAQIVVDHQVIFQRPNCYITGFGNAGKSGDIILYEYSHANIIQTKVTKTWEIQALPANSTIIFVEDIIGTGRQSVDFILDKLNQLLKPSHTPYLMALCATPDGLDNVNNNTNFEVIYGTLLDDKNYQHYSNNCTYFNDYEKQQIIELNNLLKNPNAIDYDLGLLLSFYYTIPNNSMPILWKNGYQYNNNGKQKRWQALLPRKF